MVLSSASGRADAPGEGRDALDDAGKAPIEEGLDEELAERDGCDLVLDIDVQGARQLKERIPTAVTIFILPPSRTELESRLRARSQDAEEVIVRRLQEAAEEIRNYSRYDYVVVNKEVDASVDKLVAIVNATRSRRERMDREIRPILETFEHA